MDLLACSCRLGTIRLLVFSFALFCMLPARSATYFVANSGSDDNPGTSVSAPFQTLQRAARLLLPGDVCLIRGGVYPETLVPERSGTSNAPITFAAYANEKVILNGAVPVSGWVPWTGHIFLAPVASNLSNGRNQVFVDGNMIPQAKYPQGFNDPFHPATVSVHIDPARPNVISSPAFQGRPANFWAGAWFSGGVGDKWAWQCARVLSSSGDTVTLDGTTKSSPWFTGDGVGYLWGKLNLLDGDNEWHLQTLAHTNYLCLRTDGGGNPGTHKVEMKRREWCIDLKNRNYIVVRGVWLRAGAVRMQGSGNVLEDCNATFLSHFQTFTSGYACDGGTSAGGGIVVNGNNNVVRRCVIANTAGSGIVTSGSGNIITRNLIYSTDYSGTYACAIRLNGRQNQVMFNTAHDSGRDILQPRGAGHDITFNDFSQPGQMCRDLGVIYIWGDNGQVPKGRRTRIAYNWVHDNSGDSGACPLIYLDNYCRNFAIDHNVIWDCNHDAGIRINGPASGHLLYNNTLFNCENVGTRTYNMWPGNNPEPAFWVQNTYSYASANNLFLGDSPQIALRNWLHLDFRLLPNSSSVASGKVIFGYTETRAGAVNPGAYESGSARWTAGVRGSASGQPVISSTAGGAEVPPVAAPKLTVSRVADNSLCITAPVEAASFQLYFATNLQAPVLWSVVTNVPSVSTAEWSVAMPLSTGAHYWFRLQRAE